MQKERIDQLLVSRNFFSTRERAKAAIMAGNVFVDDEKIDKAGTKVDIQANIRVKGDVHPYVSRGGLKLLKAIEMFQLNLNDRVMMDIGASTGGFTDCALQHGAAKVYAIDVGYGQLAWSLRNDPRVMVMERTNFRYLQPEDLQGERPNFVSIDVSFISLKLILPNLIHFLSPGAEIIALVKPQFEAGKGQVGKNGIVREANIHVEVLHTIIQHAKQLGYTPAGLTFSPIQGGEGNIEFLLYLTYEAPQQQEMTLDIAMFVEQTHAYFNELKNQ